MHVVFVGLPGVPYRGRACDTRLTYFANLIAKNNDVTIVNWFSPSFLNKHGRGELEDKVEIIDIIKSNDAQGIKYKLLYIISLLKEPFTLLKLNKRKHIDIFHIYTERVYIYIVYWIIAKFIGAKLIYNYVEDRSSFKSNSRIKTIQQSFAEKIAAKLCDGVIPISHYLEDKAILINPSLKSLRIPPICDFESFKSIPLQIEIHEPYLLYCGSIGYKEVIDIVYNAYLASDLCNNMRMLFVLSGDKQTLEQAVKDYSQAIILTNLEYRKLISYFKGANCLLIPLRNITSEIARFPNKVCEYIAAEGLLMTTDVGEMSYYFQDGRNAIVSKDCSVDSLKEMMNSIHKGHYNLEKMKIASYSTGREFFDMNSYVKLFNDFLLSI